MTKLIITRRRRRPHDSHSVRWRCRRRRCLRFYSARSLSQPVSQWSSAKAKARAEAESGGQTSTTATKTRIATAPQSSRAADQPRRAIWPAPIVVRASSPASPVFARPAVVCFLSVLASERASQLVGSSSRSVRSPQSAADSAATATAPGRAELAGSASAAIIIIICWPLTLAAAAAEQRTFMLAADELWHGRPIRCLRRVMGAPLWSLSMPSSV